MAFSISPLLNLALTSQIDVATTRWRNVSRIAHISLSAERCRHYGVLALHFGVTRVHGDEREILHTRETRNCKKQVSVSPSFDPFANLKNYEKIPDWHNIFAQGLAEEQPGARSADSLQVFPSDLCRCGLCP